MKLKRKIFSSQTKKKRGYKNPKIGSEEWLRGDETVSQKINRRIGTSSIGALGGLAVMLPVSNKVSDKSIEILKQATKAENDKFRNRLDSINKEYEPALKQLKKHVEEGKVLPDLANLEVNRLRKEALNKLASPEEIKKAISAAQKAADKYTYKKGIPLVIGTSLAAGIGTGAAYNHIAKKRHEKVNRQVRAERMAKIAAQKQYSENKKEDNKALRSSLGLGVGVGGGLAANKLIDTQGSNVAEYIAGKKVDRKLKKEIGKIKEGQGKQLNALKKLNLTEKDLKAATEDIARRTQNKIDMAKVGIGGEKELAKQGAKLSFKGSKGLRAAKIAVPITLGTLGAIESTRSKKRE